MSTTAKVILGIVVVLLIALGAYYFSQNGSPSGTLNGSPANSYGDQGTNTTAPSGTSAKDDSDAALTKDAAAIDAQIGAFSSDSAAADSAMNDQPVAQ